MRWLRMTGGCSRSSSSARTRWCAPCSAASPCTSSSCCDAQTCPDTCSLKRKLAVKLKLVVQVVLPNSEYLRTFAWLIYYIVRLCLLELHSSPSLLQTLISCCTAYYNAILVPEPLGKSTKFMEISIAVIYWYFIYTEQCCYNKSL